MLIRWLLANGGHIYYVTDRSGRVIGHAATLPHYIATDMPDGPKHVSGTLFTTDVVHPEYRRKGVYSALNRERMQEVVSRKSSYVTLTTQNQNVELSIKKVMEEFKRDRRIKDYTFLYVLTKTASGKRVTREEVEPCGDAEIDARYEKLNRDEGEMFELHFSISY